ncbi:hypothetical protein AVEN_34367-1 [Araneus ventricosus]|uniref:Uncharacterized protein n=1 Tax=Araneus ventricosus TaxID=182803 RepID=A0A4Y2G600_ARAVE|nr:hypothetical protein AVEN_34367-1 [Araneus ventricosus]
MVNMNIRSPLKVAHLGTRSVALLSSDYITDHKYPGCNTTETEDHVNSTVINENLQENELQDEDHTETLQPTIPESVHPYPKQHLKKSKICTKKSKIYSLYQHA